jgi:hypothetical protein
LRIERDHGLPFGIIKRLCFNRLQAKSTPADHCTEAQERVFARHQN